MPTVHMIVRGKVQGVFYRATARAAAQNLKVTGWIKNMQNGTVEIVATGSEESLQQFGDWCQEGPPTAEVEHITITPQEEVFFNEFSIVQ